jgi:hypothetical protein
MGTPIIIFMNNNDKSNFIEKDDLINPFNWYKVSNFGDLIYKTVEWPMKLKSSLLMLRMTHIIVIHGFTIISNLEI